MKKVHSQIIAVLREAHGLEVARFDDAFLLKSLEKRLAATASPDAVSYLQRLAQDRSEAETFFQSLHISFSVFFRHPLTFALLEQLVLPSLAENREKSGRAEIRIWAAGCAAGQEVWSLAILLDELATTRSCPIPFRIIATDISEAELATARQGVYDEAALQNVRLRQLRDCFIRTGQSYVVAPRLRDPVDFSTYDLLDESSASPPAGIFGDFDLVLCCNLLFYYRPELRRVIVDKVQRCLSPHGYFVTGEAERMIVESIGDFRAMAPPTAVFQKTVSTFNHR